MHIPLPPWKTQCHSWHRSPSSSERWTLLCCPWPVNMDKKITTQIQAYSHMTQAAYIIINFLTPEFLFFICIPQLYLWVSPFWVRFLRMWPFFNPTIEVVTLCLCGWRMLAVFLLPAFTCLGHKCQDLSSLCDGMHACTDKTSAYTLIRKSFGGMESEPMLTPRGKSPLLEKFSSDEDQTHNAALSRTASPTHYQLSCSGPLKTN